MESNGPLNIKEVLQPPPSYLEVFLSHRGFKEVFVAFINSSSEYYKSSKEETLTETQNNTDLDLTGCPLEVDLKGSESLIIEQDELGQCWSESENKHIPLPIKEARKYLKSKSVKIKEAVFVVCDGHNTLKTVLLGCQTSPKKIFSCSVNILGFFPLAHENVSFSAMERSHYMLAGVRKCNINYLVTLKYFMFGTFLQNLRESKYYGSVCVQISVPSKCDLHRPSDLIKEVELILQVLPGHKDSSVHFLWKELCLLQRYTDIANEKTSADSEICSNPSSVSEIYDKLKEIIASNFVLQREPNVEFDLKYIRQLTILDKLWEALKCCQNLDVLRDAFHYFFEELTASGTFTKVPPGSQCSMAVIINGIIDGKLAVPSINFNQALEFLIELGAEKLKNDYQAIIKHFHIFSSNNILDMWSQLEEKLDVQQTSRKTRITRFSKNSQINDQVCRAKLSFLSTLHIATELIYLVQREAYLPTEAFDTFCSKVYDNYIAKESSKVHFTHLQDMPLCDFKVVISLNVNKSDIIKGKPPDFCSVKLTSVIDDYEAETIYVLSKHSIMPPTIYNNYDVNDFSDMHYYAYKMESHDQTIMFKLTD